MRVSQNGWPASADKDAIGVVPFTVNGVIFPNGVKGGDVETVFRYLAEQFHGTVEPLVKGWCWGYYYKTIEGSTTISNHASATALDFNAPDHPMGSRSTFSSEQVAAIRRILTYLGGVIRWGGDFTRADDMHFEIVGTPAQVAKIAAKIQLDKEIKAVEQEITEMLSRIRYMDGRVEALCNGRDTVRSDFPLGAGSPVWVVSELKRVSARLSAIEQKLATL